MFAATKHIITLSITALCCSPIALVANQPAMVLLSDGRNWL